MSLALDGRMTPCCSLLTMTDAPLTDIPLRPLAMAAVDRHWEVGPDALG